MFRRAAKPRLSASLAPPVTEHQPLGTVPQMPCWLFSLLGGGGAQCHRHHGGFSAYREMDGLGASGTVVAVQLAGRWQVPKLFLPRTCRFLLKTFHPRHSFAGLLGSGAHDRVSIMQGLVLAHE